MSKLTKTQADIVSAVRICYDEIALNDANMTGDQDESELDTIIKSKVNEALRFVYENCNEELLEDGDVKVYEETGFSLDSDGCYSLNITTKIGDFLRLMWAKCNSWPYALKTAVSEGDDDAAYIVDKYCGADKNRPALVWSHSMVATTSTSSGSPVTSRNYCRILKFYRPDGVKNAQGYTLNSDSITLAYLPSIDLSGSDTSLSISERLWPALVNYISGLVAVTFGEKARAQEFFEIAMGYMGKVASGK